VGINWIVDLGFKFMSYQPIKNRDQSGQTLIETLVGIFILVIESGLLGDLKVILWM
jgi:Tfp pilus assembly protein PilV